MTLAHQYAQALFEAGGDKKHFANLKEAMKRRGHERLLPAVYEEYQKLLLARERIKLHTRASSKKERTRILIELYQKLIATN